jgi:DNA mismatch endonuclease, patch repair protein
VSDVMTPAQRSYCMSRIRGADTKPEIELRKALWHLGLRYRIRNKLPGRPDLVIRSTRTVIFVDGCFWHRCPVHSKPPKTNSQFWQDKLEINVSRDHRVTRELKAMGWRVIRIWEHEIVGDPHSAATRLLRRICQAKAIRHPS